MFRCDCCGQRISRKVWLQHRILAQRKWIEDHGLTLAGYVRRYGSVEDADHYGAGGEAIFRADIEALRKLEHQQI